MNLGLLTVTQEPEMKFLPSGTALLNLNLVKNIYKGKNDDGSSKYVPVWIRGVIWGASAESASRRLSKGSQIVVNVSELNPDGDTGNPRVFQRNDGSWGASYEITIRDYDIPKNNDSGGGATARPVADADTFGGDSDIPF